MYCFPSVNGTIEKTINIGLEIRRHIAERFFQNKHLDLQKKTAREDLLHKQMLEVESLYLAWLTWNINNISSM